MEKLTISEIKEFTKGEFLSKTSDNYILDICTDSREVNQDSLFIPLIGENFDGHTFMEKSYELGCRNFLIDKNHTFNKDDINLIKVDDTLISYGDIGKCYKEKYNTFTVAVTGSVGKTSTKDIIHSVVNEKYKTLKNEGNFNNEIGIPKTLLNLDDSYEVAICEMGMSFKGDLHYFSSIVKPNIAVISNIGMSHIENFPNQEGIFKGKMEVIDFFNEDNTLIINGDDEYLKTLIDEKQNYKLLSYGFNEYNTIYCTSYEFKKDHIDFTCMINEKEESFTIPSIAKHNIYNSMAAILVGLELNIDISLIKKGLSSFILTKGRQTIINKKDMIIIDDSYNASADSIISALNVLHSFSNRKVAILGDILETGSYQEELHRLVGKNINPNVDFLICVGKSSKYIIDEAIKDGFNFNNIKHYDKYEDLLIEIDNLIKKDDVILVKASHGIHLDKVVEYLTYKYE